MGRPGKQRVRAKWQELFLGPVLCSASRLRARAHTARVGARYFPTGIWTSFPRRDASRTPAADAGVCGFTSPAREVATVRGSVSACTLALGMRSDTRRVRAPDFTRFASFTALCVREETGMQGLRETRQKVMMRFCMTSFPCISGKLRSPVAGCERLASKSFF
jgi:hypothetical protein